MKTDIMPGDYVLATKWSDGDPGDHWGVGFYDRTDARGRHYVKDRDGNQIRGNGFRRVGKISPTLGFLLLHAGKSLEALPPGSVNLWEIVDDLTGEHDG